MGAPRSPPAPKATPGAGVPLSVCTSVRAPCGPSLRGKPLRRLTAPQGLAMVHRNTQRVQTKGTPNLPRSSMSRGARARPSGRTLSPARRGSGRFLPAHPHGGPGGWPVVACSRKIPAHKAWPPKGHHSGPPCRPTHPRPPGRQGGTPVPPCRLKSSCIIPQQTRTRSGIIPTLAMRDSNPLAPESHEVVR